MKHTHSRRYFSVLAGLLLAIIWVLPAKAETTICTPITAIPTTISTPGVYCLTGNLAFGQTSGSAITINANDVTLDLNGHKLDGGNAGAGTQAVGIIAVNRKNLAIKNGTIRGFYRGILLAGSASRGHVVEGIRAEGNTSMGIVVKGKGSIVRRNQVLDTGGSTYRSNVSAFGLYAGGDGVQVMNNEVTYTHGSGTASTFGIYVSSGSQGAVVHGNRVSNPSLPDSGKSYGVYVTGASSAPSHYVALSHNSVARMSYGLFFTSYTSGLYAHNLVAGCTTPFTNGTAASSSVGGSPTNYTQL